MKRIFHLNVDRFIFAAALIIGFGCGTSASAQQTGHSYLIGLNSKAVTDLGNVEAIAIKIREKSAISSFRFGLAAKFAAD